MPSSSDDIVEKIKDLLGPSLLDQAYDLMFGNLIDSFEPFIANRLGPKSGRIFSFGPNSMDGPNVIDKTARMISRLGLFGLTIDHYYEPNRPDSPLPIGNALPKEILSLQTNFPSYVYLRNMPRIASRGIFYENDERGQAIELLGCAKFGIPRLGYIVHQKLNEPESSSLKNSDFLHLDSSGFTECKAWTKSLCDHINSGYFCPFYDSISIPWNSLELFLNEDCTIVAVPDHESLQEPLRRFIQHGVSKKSWMRNSS